MALFVKMALQTSIDLRRLFELLNGELENVRSHAGIELSSKEHDFKRFCAFWHLADTLEVAAEGTNESEGQGGVRGCLEATVAVLFGPRTVP